MSDIPFANGAPTRDYMIATLEAFTETHFVKSRDELYLRECPECHGTDDRCSGKPQGAISYSFRINCLNCKKCGAASGWLATLKALGVEIDGREKPFAPMPERPKVEEVETTTAETTEESAADMIRKMGKSTKAAKPEREFVDHGDRGLDLGVAADHHLRRLMSPDSKVRPWLEARGFRFWPGDDERPNEAWAGESKAGWLVHIYRGEGGEIRGFKYRNIETKEFMAQKGVQSKPYGIEALTSENTTRVIVEGELDCEALRLGYGAKNVISLPNGAQSWDDKWCRYLEGADKVFIAIDDDDVGNAAVENIVASISGSDLITTVESIVRVRFCDALNRPVKDANDALMGGATKEQILQAFADAEDPDLVAIERSDLNTDGRFVKSGWGPFDDTLGGGFLIGEVTHLAGSAKCGKTSLMIDLHARLAEGGVKSGFVALDMETSKIALRFAMAALGKDDAEFYRSSGEERDGYIQMMPQALKERFGGKLMFNRSKRISTYGGALSAIERLGKAGAKLITVEDFLSLISMQERESKKSKTMYGARQVITDLSQIAARTACHIVLINHLKADEKVGVAYGAGQIGATAQANIHVYAERDWEGSMKASVMHIRENRFSSKADVDIRFSYATGSRQLVASGPVKHAKKDKKGKGSGGEDWKDGPDRRNDW